MILLDSSCVMMESHLHFGNQPLRKDLSQLRYGVSITDACLDWEATERAIREAARKLAPLTRAVSPVHGSSIPQAA